MAAIQPPWPSHRDRDVVTGSRRRPAGRTHVRGRRWASRDRHGLELLGVRMVETASALEWDADGLEVVAGDPLGRHGV